MNEILYPYKEFDTINNLDLTFLLIDHLNGFDEDFKNRYFDRLQQYAQANNLIYNIFYHQILPNQVLLHYKNLKINFLPFEQNKINLAHFLRYTQHPVIDFKNFICSFNKG